MLMMRGLRRPRFTQRSADGPRFTQRPADADDARPPSAQVYIEAG